MDNFQDSIDKAVKEVRQKEFAASKQLTLGQLIEQIEACGLTGNDDSPKTVCYDFIGAIPTTLASYRGFYAELALGWKQNNEYPFPGITAENLLNELKSAIGGTYEGWKGGDFVMSKDTPVWADNPGKCTRTAIVGVRDNSYEIIILTDFIDN